jgi:hypothetical protein
VTINQNYENTLLDGGTLEGLGETEEIVLYCTMFGLKDDLSELLSDLHGFVFTNLKAIRDNLNSKNSSSLQTALTLTNSLGYDFAEIPKTFKEFRVLLNDLRCYDCSEKCKFKSEVYYCLLCGDAMCGEGDVPLDHLKKRHGVSTIFVIAETSHLVYAANGSLFSDQEALYVGNLGQELHERSRWEDFIIDEVLLEKVTRLVMEDEVTRFIGIYNDFEV